jgi:hypothetical protein
MRAEDVEIPSIMSREDGKISRQEFCTNLLGECLASDSHELGVRRWDEFWQSSYGENPVRIIIADLDLRGISLSGYNFRYCYFARVRLNDCDLRHVDFYNAIARDCHLNWVDLRGTIFNGADFKGSVVIPSDWDKTTQPGWRAEPSNIADLGLPFREHVAIHRTIQHYKETKRTRLEKVWDYATNYGTSMRRFLPACALVMFVYAIVFAILGKCLPQAFNRPIGSMNCFLLSVARFFNISYEVDSSNQVVQMIMFSETIVGLIATAVLLALILRRVVLVR